jgi:hypothetical protein
MTPKGFLEEEFANVKRALRETLRYDYGPEETRIYYNECDNRLKEIEKQIAKIAPSEIWAQLNELASLSVWISLIERSRLGEFSWPFAALIRDIAKPLLTESIYHGKKTIEPIIHVVAEGEGYQIVYEVVPPPSTNHRFAIVAFPRPLKHHVLLHTIFGHEIGHTAQHTNDAGDLIGKSVADELTAAGQLSGAAEMTTWLHDGEAPKEIRSDLALYLADSSVPYAFQEAYVGKWVEELICDLFGLLLFGPGFVAAHQTLLRPSHRTPYEIDLLEPTHPPYAIRHKMLVMAMRILGWDSPVTKAAQGDVYEAELEALKFIFDDPYGAWAIFFDDQQLGRAIQGIQTVLSQYGSFGYQQPDPQIFAELVGRLKRRLPPISADIDESGNPAFKKISMAHSLFAGWVYWLGKDRLVKGDGLGFLETNKLCDQALLQERGIALAIST